MSTPSLDSCSGGRTDGASTCAEAKVVYSGLSAAAHAQPWATANFYDFEANRLRRDDKMLMEYCMYVIETTRLVSDQIVQRFDAERADIDRWKQTNAQVYESLSAFVRPTGSPT
ncbi:hypothetical protein [Tessaracoccus lacteus]|uniref:Uncharacterized protein n=1 Tax=Tessaracoccus lacteus TaxID=3041766 RepID=A0ABY8PX03_9ACTN|nr:hypothetical protein [Tessaracoccus sp. T21]WGT46985.1 hypothetical protein QH948_12775 [Tessaracoccus sp. T21]